MKLYIKKKTKKPRDAKLAYRYAHRGYHDKPRIPENSLPAFRRAIEHGFPSEFDVHLIADGSLVVFHDEELKRVTGISGQIEDYDLVNLGKLRLEGTNEVIPTFDDVLKLYENTGLPLLIELKTARGNYAELARAVCERLDSYKGDFVIESFDPRALIAVRKLRPEIRRGQLVQNFLKRPEGLPKSQAILLTKLVLNTAVRPDFMAYRFTDRDERVFRRVINKQGIAEAVWTIHTPEDYTRAVELGCVPIFEKFNPDEI